MSVSSEKRPLIRKLSHFGDKIVFGDAIGKLLI